jgi:DNA-directed RNA polymerase specialized sigma24 family protein
MRPRQRSTGSSVLRQATDANEITFYEGLIRKTAAIYAPRVDDDYDDVLAVLRVKVWRALLAYDPTRSRLPVERYVFSCVVNQVKDLLKRKRRHEMFISDMGETTVTGDDLGDAFAQDYMSVGHDQVYADVEAETLEIPATLTPLEREVVVRLCLDASHHSATIVLQLTRSQLETTVESIRTKMTEWRATARERKT